MYLGGRGEESNRLVRTLGTRESLAEAGLTLPELRTGWEASSRLLGPPECPRFSQTLICQSDKSIALSAVIRLTGRPNALLRVTLCSLARASQNGFGRDATRVPTSKCTSA